MKAYGNLTRLGMAVTLVLVAAGCGRGVVQSVAPPPSSPASPSAGSAPAPAGVATAAPRPVP
ncbi:MAG TPA: hypothetical protein VIJ69_07845, partial [Actinomycetota bacterium]